VRASARTAIDAQPEMREAPGCLPIHVDPALYARSCHRTDKHQRTHIKVAGFTLRLRIHDGPNDRSTIFRNARMRDVSHDRYLYAPNKRAPVRLAHPAYDK
jgi:hypothetical protein